VYQDQGKYTEAAGLFERALAIREKALGANHPDVGQTLNNLALVYWKQGKYSEAEGLYKRALAILEKALGANHLDVAWTLNDLALVYRAEGRYEEAEALFKRALTIREKTLGASHTQVGKTLNNLGLVYRDQGRYVEAEEFLKRALTIKERALGTSHPDVASTLTNLANVYQDQARYGDAEGLHKRALSITENAKGAYSGTRFQRTSLAPQNAERKYLAYRFIHSNWRIHLTISARRFAPWRRLRRKCFSSCPVHISRLCARKLQSSRSRTGCPQCSSSKLTSRQADSCRMALIWLRCIDKLLPTWRRF
jgi:tetratricopeptide (TPR) repeat protein